MQRQRVHHGEVRVNIDNGKLGAGHGVLWNMQHAPRFVLGKREGRSLRARQACPCQTGEPSPSREGGHVM